MSTNATLTRNVSHSSLTPPSYPPASKPASQEDGSKARRRSLVDIMTLGVIADPWRKLPWGARWRSSPWFLTLVVASGVCTDLLTYTVVVPVMPYRLQSQGYDNIANLTSYLLIAYSVGLTVATPIVSYVFHRFPYRRGPLMTGLVMLQLSLILFMLANPYWCAVVARVMQGISSAIVWAVGMALICENVDSKVVGRQLGFAMSGVSIGTSLGPVIGGALYDSLGWHAPFIFCIIMCSVDFVGRLLLVERKELLRYGIDFDHADGPADPEASAAGKEKEGEAPPAKTSTDGKETTNPDGTASPNLDTPSSDRTSTEPTTTTAAPPPIEEKTEESHGPAKVKHLSPFQVIAKLLSSPRATTGLALVFAFSFAISSMDPVLTLRIENVWNKDSTFVGLVYLAAAIPTFFVGPIAGHLADKYGAGLLTAGLIVISLPWTPLLILKSSLPGFVVYFAIWNAIISGIIAPVGQELAMVTKGQEGISDIHQFGAFNMSFSVASVLGPILGGQIYDHLSNGWTILCWLWLVFMAAPLPLVLWYTGDRPIGKRLLGYYRNKDDEKDNKAINEEPTSA